MAWLWLFLTPSALAGPQPTVCPEHPVILRVAKEQAEAVKHRFLVLSSLPFDVAVHPAGKEAELVIGYACPGPEDEFAHPGPVGLLERVAGILKDDAKKLGIKSLRVDLGG
jgi:hypothetical protein